MNGNYKPGDTILDNWTLKKVLGHGSFGCVFEAERRDLGSNHVYKSAIKIITIPQNNFEAKDLLAEGMSEQSIVDYYRSLAGELENEIAIMYKLKGNSNIVSYEDHRIVPHTGGMGRDIIIRMELLTPLTSFAAEKPMSQAQVVRVGIDICKALEVCGDYSIIHRDIKPANIMVSDRGVFKLGDFGIARTMERKSSELSKKGTYLYMAPEVYGDADYGSAVDIYSLGIVLYRLLNNNRAPFMPPYPQTYTAEERDAAVARRFSGEPIPRPARGDKALVDVVLKACAHNPAMRYKSPGEMRIALEKIYFDDTDSIPPKKDGPHKKEVKKENSSVMDYYLNLNRGGVGKQKSKDGPSKQLHTAGNL